MIFTVIAIVMCLVGFVCGFVLLAFYDRVKLGYTLFIGSVLTAWLIAIMLCFYYRG